MDSSKAMNSAVEVGCEFACELDVTVGIDDEDDDGLVKVGKKPCVTTAKLSSRNDDTFSVMLID